MDEKDTIVSPDEAQAEQEALAEAKADEVRAKVVADLGLADDDSNKPVIDKLVERELSHKKKLSEAIGQKIKWRDQVKGAKPAATVTKDTQPLDAETIRRQTETTVTERLEQRDLEEMEYPDDVKAEIKKLAQIKGVSVRAAAKDPYISHLVEQAKAAGRIDEAAVTRTPRSTTAKTTGTPKFDLSTEEGRKEFDDWKKSKSK